MIETIGKMVNRISPLWLYRPNCVQIDTQNSCNLKCVYCNVRENAGFSLPRGKMDDAMLEYVIKYWRGKHVWAIAPFMNGEPMLETRLPKINEWTENIGAIGIVDTNGSIYQNRSLLVHPNLKIVRFTISACDSETYENVHGKDLFRSALHTFNWFQKNKYGSQKPMLHFIINKFNEGQLEEYIKFFVGNKIRVFSLHEGKGQLSSENAKGLNNYHPPLIVEPDGRRHFEVLSNTPCQCWDILGIGYNGEIMQCCDFPYKFNYGNVKDTDMMDAWRERIRNKMDNSCCKECNTKFPNWKKIIDKYIR